MIKILSLMEVKTSEETYNKVISHPLMTNDLIRLYTILYYNPMICISKVSEIHSALYEPISYTNVRCRLDRLKKLSLVDKIENKELDPGARHYVYWFTTDNLLSLSPIKKPIKAVKEESLKAIRDLYLNIYDIQRRDVKKKLKVIFNEISKL